MRFIHTSDWHVGKVFGFVDDADKAGVLRHARLEVITRIGQLAREHAAEAVLVAGDVFERPDVGDHTGAEPLQRMRHCPGVQWHLIPGNHDALQPSSIWDRLMRGGVPDNVHVHLDNAPARLGAEAWILPAPLARRRSLGDPTAWMDEFRDLPADAVRIGLAHGAVFDFGNTGNLIAPDRTTRAGLDYLALGDAHAPCKVQDRAWYAGTPEPLSFDEEEAGRVLLVDLPGRGSPAAVEALASGHHLWRRMQAEVLDGEDIQRLEQRVLLAGEGDPSRLVVDLKLRGTLPLEELRLLEERIGGERSGGRLRAAICWLRLERDIHPRPSPGDLDVIAPAGVLRAAAARLIEQIETADGERRILAERALLLLHSERRRLEAMS